MNRLPPHAHDASLEARLAARLAGGLSVHAERLPHDVTERLRVAREQALARARQAARQPAATGRPVASPVWQPASAGGPGGSPFGGPAPWWQRVAALLPLIVLVAGLVAIDQWVAHEQVLAAAEIDAQILSDDLPPQAYSDPAFAEFLRSPPAAP